MDLRALTLPVGPHHSEKSGGAVYFPNSYPLTDAPSYVSLLHDTVLHFNDIQCNAQISAVDQPPEPRHSERSGGAVLL